jgi:hypothetical protein
MSEEGFAMPRKYLDCREAPNEVGCTLRISGEEHALSVHDEKDTPETESMLRGLLRDEDTPWRASAATIQVPQVSTH